MKPLLLKVVIKLDSIIHTNDWELSFLRLPAFLRDDRDLFRTLSESFTLRVLNLDLPKWEAQPIQLVHRGHVFQLPGLWDTPRTMSMALLETSDTPVHRLLEMWRAAVASVNWPGSSSPDYQVSSVKADISLRLLSRMQLPTLGFNIYGVFPTGVDYGQVTGDKGAPYLQIQVTFSYDYFYGVD